MARTYGLACTECKRYVWIAQRGVTDKTQIYDTEEIREALKAFLFEHIGHPLVFEDTEPLSVDDYVDVTAEDESQSHILS